MNVLPFALTKEQASRLLAYIQTYRRHVLTQLAPSTDRNAIQRYLQALQGKLIQEMDQRGAITQLALTHEEKGALQSMVADFLQVTKQEPATEQRDATLQDLSALKTALEQLTLPRPRHMSTRALF